MRRYLVFRLIRMIFCVVGIGATGNNLFAQGVTTGSLSGTVMDDKGQVLQSANVTAVHEASGTRYGALSTKTGTFTIPNMRVGGPYTVTASYVGYAEHKEEKITISLGQTVKIDFKLKEGSVQGEEILTVAQKDEVLNRDRTGAATYVSTVDILQLPSIKRSTQDLTRLDPRSDGSFSFGGRNWLYNNLSLDGSYFNNSFGLDNPAPGGQTNAEPIPFDAVEQVQVSIAPFDIREGGFTGANINTVTKSGTNRFHGSIYSFYRNESFVGNKIRGDKVIANPDLLYYQSGVSFSGPLIKDKLFFFINAEIERRDDPASNFVASNGTNNGNLGVSRVEASVMNQIRQRMIEEYSYDPGKYQNFKHHTGNEKMLAKLDWNADEHHKVSLRYNRLRASLDKPPHPFVLSPGGRGPNESSLPFQNSGYEINNGLNSIAFEANSHYNTFTNRFFLSYNRFRDFRDPFSSAFPTIDIAEGGVTYTTIGHEPFSIHNVLDQDVWQVTNNFSYFTGPHVVTAGINFEHFSFFNSFNIFRHGVFFLPYGLFPGTARFSSVADFLAATAPGGGQADFNSFVAGDTPYKGEDIKVGQLAFYVQDEYALSDRVKLTGGLRVDIPMYFNDLEPNPFSTGLTALDENDNPETVNQAKLPGGTPLISPRLGFNYDVHGDRSTQLRGGTGIFTGRLPFVWIGNVISNPGANPNLYPGPGGPTGVDASDEIPTQSFDVNAMVKDFKWPQMWTTNIAVDHKLPYDILGTLEFIFGKDINGIYMRNADLVTPVRTLSRAGGRPYYGGFGANELNPDGAAGIYVIDNKSQGYNYSLTTQLRKIYPFGLSTGLSYTYMQAKSLMKSTEIASVLWTENPVKGDPNKPGLANSEFGQRHRIVGHGTYQYKWNEKTSTSIGLFFEIAEGNTFQGAGGNRYSFTYAGDVNGDGSAVNDLIYIPRNSSEIVFVDIPSGMTAAEQWTAFNKFIKQDDYLSENRGKTAERFGAVNPWYTNIDLRIMQDLNFSWVAKQNHVLQLSLDILNFGNFISSSWGVRKVASSSATVPLSLVGFDGGGEPEFNFVGPSKTYVDDPSVLSRWRMQLGIRYSF